MIGNWLNNFPGNWFGYWFGPKEPAFLCKPTIVIIYESRTITLVEELTLTWKDDDFDILTDKCPLQ